MMPYIVVMKSTDEMNAQFSSLEQQTQEPESQQKQKQQQEEDFQKLVELLESQNMRVQSIRSNSLSRYRTSRKRRQILRRCGSTSSCTLSTVWESLSALEQHQKHQKQISMSRWDSSCSPKSRERKRHELRIPTRSFSCPKDQNLH